MVRDKDKLEERHVYFKRIVSKSPSTQKAVQKLAKRFYISERTVYRDLAK